MTDLKPNTFQCNIRTDGKLTEEDFLAIPAGEISSIYPSIAPLVSVLMITFNHEAHISQAIESVSSQQCDFPFELIIGEDCSADRTREICFEYREKYPSKVRVVFSDENVGMHRNFARIWHRARGKYIALCEGDDYWTDPRKLAKQVEYMQKRPDYTMCGTYTAKVCRDESGNWRDCGSVGPAGIREHYGLEDLIPSYNFHFSSVLLKKDAVDFPRWFWDVYCVDRPLYLLCAEKGPVGFLPEETSAYRLHEGGIWSSSRNLEKAEKGIELFNHIDKHFKGRYRKRIRRTLGAIVWSYMAESLETGDRRSAGKLFWLSMGYNFPTPKISMLRAQLIVLMRLYFPALYKVLRYAFDRV